MQKPRPKEAPAPHRQRSPRDTDTSNRGAPALLVISGGEKAAENPARPTDNGTLNRPDEARARQVSTDPTIIVFGFNERRLPKPCDSPKPMLTGLL
jgi:hypothetical protein